MTYRMACEVSPMLTLKQCQQDANFLSRPCLLQGKHKCALQVVHDTLCVGGSGPVVVFCRRRLFFTTNQSQAVKPSLFTEPRQIFQRLVLDIST